MTTKDTLPAENAAAAAQGPAEAQAARRRYRGAALQVARRPTAALSILVLAAVVLAAFLPHLFTSANPLATNPSQILLAPGRGHIFGTDEVGRDLYARVVYGAHASLTAALIAILISFTGGAILGLVAGYFGGAADMVIMRVADVILAFPAVLLTMAVVTVLGFGTLNVAAAVGTVGIAGMARVMRSEVLRVREETYVEAARVSGAPWYTALARHVLPNSVGPLAVLAALEFGTAILSVSSLSFLGFGTPPPAPEWGALIADGQEYLSSAWWLTTIPGIVLAVTVIAANRLSRLLDGELERAMR
jgi:peptide/nickel transport system permease protein